MILADEIHIGPTKLPKEKQWTAKWESDSSHVDCVLIKIIVVVLGLTPVHLAVLSGSKDALKLLNSAGANMSAQVWVCSEYLSVMTLLFLIAVSVHRKAESSKNKENHQQRGNWLDLHVCIVVSGGPSFLSEKFLAQLSKG